MELHDKLREFRQKMDISQKEMAHLLGIDQRSISAYERGKRIPSYSVLVRLRELAQKRQIRISLV